MHPHLHAPRRRSAPNAAATADVSHPVKQGFVQSLGMVTDTLVICSATALVILFDRFCTSRSREVREEAEGNVFGTAQRRCERRRNR
jgi:Na+/alanine symporter